MNNNQQLPQSNNKVHFPGLNTLRFFAAFVVWVTHAHVMLRSFGFNGVIPAAFPIHPETGKLGVILFFVLSGYLITYLLLIEKKQRTTIEVKKFYIRRILRIWPIYYLMTFAGFFLFPIWPAGLAPAANQPVFGDFTFFFLLYIFMLPNLAGAVPFIDHFWSIGAEEQFYLVWPLLLKSSSIVITMCFGVILVHLLTSYIYLGAGDESTIDYYIREFLRTARFDCLAIGGLTAAVLFFEKNRWLAVLTSRTTQWIAYVGLVALYFSGFHHEMLGYTVFAVFFALIILNVSSNPKTLFKFDWTLTNYLGRISYGLYVYHPVCIYLTAAIAVKLIDPSISDQWTTRSLALVSGVLTVLVSAASYRFLEVKFLSLKPRFSYVLSSDR